jgi:hypothetical protein
MYPIVVVVVLFYVFTQAQYPTVVDWCTHHTRQCTTQKSPTAKNSL